MILLISIYLCTQSGNPSHIEKCLNSSLPTNRKQYAIGSAVSLSFYDAFNNELFEYSIIIRFLYRYFMITANPSVSVISLVPSSEDWALRRFVVAPVD